MTGGLADAYGAWAWGLEDLGVSTPSRPHALTGHLSTVGRMALISRAGAGKFRENNYSTTLEKNFSNNYSGEPWLNAITPVIIQRFTTPTIGGVPLNARNRDTTEISPRRESLRHIETALQ